MSLRKEKKEHFKKVPQKKKHLKKSHSEEKKILKKTLRKHFVKFSMKMKDAKLWNWLSVEIRFKRCLIITSGRTLFQLIVF